MEAPRGSLLSPAATASPPDVSFPDESCSPEPKSLADRVLGAPAQWPAAGGGNPAAPSGRPRSDGAPLVPAATPTRGAGAEQAQRTYLRGQGAGTALRQFSN